MYETLPHNDVYQSVSHCHNAWFTSEDTEVGASGVTNCLIQSMISCIVVSTLFNFKLDPACKQDVLVSLEWNQASLNRPEGRDDFEFIWIRDNNRSGTNHCVARKDATCVLHCQLLIQEAAQAHFRGGIYAYWQLLVPFTIELSRTCANSKTKGIQKAGGPLFHVLQMMVQKMDLLGEVNKRKLIKFIHHNGEHLFSKLQNWEERQPGAYVIWSG